MSLPDQFRLQARVTRPRAPLYGELLEHAAADLEAGGPTAPVMAGTEHDSDGTVPPLRLMGALHRLVLDGAAPDLAPYYPSVGGTAPHDQAWPAARTVLAERTDVLRHLVRRPLQTNEVGRSAVLYGVLRLLALRHRLPVRLLEIGSSAGVNLHPERHAYEVGGRVFGDPAGAVRFQDPWDRDPAGGRDDARVEVAERAGCDPDALDPSATEDRRTLESYVWADQVWRLERLRTALDVAAVSEVRVERAPAAAWLAARLAEPAPERLTVVWHSVVWQYLATDERTGVRAAVVRAAAAATAGAPLAVLGFEPHRPEHGGADFEFLARIRVWPGGADEETLAVGGGHGPPLRWLT